MRLTDLMLSYLLLTASFESREQAQVAVPASAQRRGFWLVTTIVALIIAFPWYGPLLIQ